MRSRIPLDSTEDEAKGARGELMKELRAAFPEATVKPSPWSPEAILVSHETNLAGVESTVWVWVTLDGQMYVCQSKRFKCVAENVVDRVQLALLEAML